MPTLDVSDVLLSPEFLDTSLVCSRSAQSTDADGFTTNSTSQLPFAGVVTVDKSLENARMEAGQVVRGAILVITRFILTEGTSTNDADVVTYRGRDYRVSFVDYYTEYGAGFVQAHCELLPFDGGAANGI
ncbi:head-tail adaptor [Tatumella sp. JGM130]|uniref:head-tail adaptor n=1 Tax=Tatumella sp. JGM130 TaxID=2799797 RepID=UPI001BB0CFBB|nr:head-tail adaptor [Tatumella sp. JGM130]MBS0893959.1 head-tail adaptor [Tatumella sp. JGM130]